MLEVVEVQSIDQLGALKQQYMDRTTAPLDGMWLCGFVPMAKHFAFNENGTIVGFCCINDEGYILQFHLSPRTQQNESELFDAILHSENLPTPKVKGAFASTAEPAYLSLCLDTFSTHTVNALMYQLVQSSVPGSERGTTVVEQQRLPELVEFAAANVGAPEEWLNGYYTDLISRQELFILEKDGRIVAAGESRGYDEYQTDYADLGVIVAESMRRKGLATSVLKELVTITRAKGLIPICSTEKTNVGAQKAIERAGFRADNRIVQFDL